jgi:hypothetical protein
MKESRHQITKLSAMLRLRIDFVRIQDRGPVPTRQIAVTQSI